MSTNLVHVLTAIGDHSAEIEAGCDTLLAKRVEQDPRSYGTDDWSDQDRQEIDKFCKTLIASARDLPILYYATYLDGWSMAGAQYRLLEWPDGVWRQICGDSYDLAYYPFAFRDDLLSQIKACRRRKFYREQAEDRWYLDQIRNAIGDALWLEAPFLVVSVTEWLGPTRHDEDIRAALKAQAMGRTGARGDGSMDRG
jgi:hypothetical protein